MKKTFFIIFISLFIFNSCGGTSGKYVCTTEDKKDFVYLLFKTSYYWASSTPDVNLSNYADEEELFDALKNEKDRFSFILDNNVYEKEFVDTTSTDFGFLTTYLDDINKTVVLFVYPNSAVDEAGIKRSDIISDLTIIDDNTTQVTIISTDGQKKDINLTQKVYTKKEIAKTQVYDLYGEKIGYFVLNSFIGKNIIENLDKTFSYFKKEDVKDLIIDLRYNMGGDIDIASHLATLISGEKSYSNIFQYHKFNENNSYKNSISYFDDSVVSPLNLDRVFVLTTNLTASASESLISALRADENNMSVIIIGTQTYGKPYSMYALDYCDKVFFPILMKNFNSNMDEDYDNGFMPTCEKKDDYYHDFGDLNESLLKEALYYIKNESCSY